MSKTKLAMLVFCIAFGLNGVAFLFSKKTFVTEEVKNVWLYELPLTATPLDGYMTLAMGPQQGVIGTVFMPDPLTPVGGLDAPKPILNLLADSWKWDAKKSELDIQLKKDLHYSNGDLLPPGDWVQSHAFIVTLLPRFISSSIWTAWQDSTYEEIPGGIKIKLAHLSDDFDLEKFLSEVLTHPLAGVFHAKNIEAMRSAKSLTKDWISSGPYLIWKWNPKEIELAVRSDFPGGMRKDFFRTLKFQSAPVKNPSCDFMQGRDGDESALKEHTGQNTESTVHVFWICRSWKDAKAFCNDPKKREILASLLSSSAQHADLNLSGEMVRYRIPTGSDDFRNEIRTKINAVVEQAQGKAQETSYFFKPSSATDLEILFVTTARMKNSTDFATSLASLSSRLGPGAINERNLVGEIMSFPSKVFMKNRKSPVFQSIFLEPDLDEKKLPL